MAKRQKPITPAERIRKSILLIRSQKVILDADLAELYGVETKALTRAMKRNIERFPADFMFQLTKSEFDGLRYQSGASNAGRGGKQFGKQFSATIRLRRIADGQGGL